MLEGARSGRVLLLLEGRVKVSRLTEDGREIIVSIREPGELLGDLSLLSDRAHTATVTAMEPVRALCVEGHDFMSLLKEHPRAGLALLVVQAGRLVEADMHRMEFGTQDVTGRVARRLAELASRFGEKTADGIRLALPISQRELASWTGASREGVTAPGVCILSTWPLGGYRVLSGTSMASPHVAGAAAILTSGANDPQSRSDVAAVRDVIVGSGNFDWQDDSGDGIQESLVDVGNAEVFIPNSPTRTLGTSPDPSPDNEVPVASFTHSCSKLTCSFDATGSSDSDGTISSYSWDFGDGTAGSGPTMDKSYEASGTYTVVLTVTDDGGAAATRSKSITVSSSHAGSDEGESFRLSASGTRLSSTATINLYWYGTDLAGAVGVYRNGEAIATTADDGSHTDLIENSSGSYTYKICEEGTTRCSNEVTMF